MSKDGQGTERRRNIAENFNGLSRAHERYRQTTDGRATSYSERELEFTFAKKPPQFRTYTFDLANKKNTRLLAVTPNKLLGNLVARSSRTANRKRAQPKYITTIRDGCRVWKGGLSEGMGDKSPLRGPETKPEYGIWDTLSSRSLSSSANYTTTRMWANAQHDGRPAEHRWRPLFNAAKFS